MEEKGSTEIIPSFPKESRRVGCARCNRTVVETAMIEAAEGTKIMLKLRCRNRGCGAWNVISLTERKITVSQLL